MSESIKTCVPPYVHTSQTTTFVYIGKWFFIFVLTFWQNKITQVQMCA